MRSVSLTTPDKDDNRGGLTPSMSPAASSFVGMGIPSFPI